MTQQFANAARSTLASGISAGDTELMLDGGGNLFPTARSTAEGTTWFKAVIQEGSSIEVVEVHTRYPAGSNVLGDVVRGAEGTTAQAFGAGAVVGLRFTAGDAALLLAALGSAGGGINVRPIVGDHVLGADDANSLLVVDATAADATLEIPRDSVVNHPVGTAVYVTHLLTGDLEFITPAGVVGIPNNRHHPGPGEVVALVKIADNMWMVAGGV